MGFRIPRLARKIVSAALPPDERRAIVAELDDEYVRHVRPVRGRVGARMWYWSQALRSIGPAIVMRRRRARRVLVFHGENPAPAGRRVLEQTGQDLRIALRTLARRPGFAAAAILTFALGIGVNTAIFSLVDGVLLRPLPYRDSSRLVRVWSANPRGLPRNAVSPADYYDLAEQARSAGALDSLSAFTTGDTSTMTGGRDAVRLTTSMVSHELFETLGVRPSRGRGFQASDAVAPSAVVISDRLWKTSFSGRPDIIGVPLTLDGTTYTIAGVMPRSFDFPSPAVDAWLPMPAAERQRSRSAHYLDVVGRLAPGASESAARDALRTIAGRLEAQYPDSNRGWSVTVASLHESTSGEVRRPLLVLLAAVTCVLLIACANVAGLMMARAAGRSREIAVRAALGAGRGRIAAGQLYEAMILALAGGAAGLAIAWLALEAVRGSAGYQIPRVHEVGLDFRVLLVTAAVSILTGAAAGLAPAWRAARTDPDSALKAGRSAGPGLAATRARTTLVTAQIALALALTTGAGLLVKSFARLTSVDAGFNADRVLLAQVSFTSPRSESGRWAEYVDRALGELRALPGVASAGAGAPLPLSGQPGLLRFGVRFEGRPDPAPGQNDRAYLRWATPDYFRAMGIPIVDGRAFDGRDAAGSLPAAVVDRTFVDRYFHGQRAIGSRIRLTNERVFREIVGVVGAVRPTRLEDEAEPHVYLAQGQNPSPAMTFVVRAQGDPMALAGPVRAALHAIDPSQPIYNVRTLRDVVAGAAAARRFNALVLVTFAALAAALTLVGIYALMAFWVTASRRDFGVRLALGARREEIVAMVVARGLRFTVWGAALGVALSIVASRLMSGLLFGVTPGDPAVLAASTTLLFAAGIAGSYFPARRALRHDPAESLRTDA